MEAGLRPHTQRTLVRANACRRSGGGSNPLARTNGGVRRPLLGFSRGPGFTRSASGWFLRGRPQRPIRDETQEALLAEH